jgi:hypothetical protein
MRGDNPLLFEKGRTIALSGHGWPEAGAYPLSGVASGSFMTSTGKEVRIMPLRMRRRMRLYWPYCQWHHYVPYAPPPPWFTGRPTREEEVEDLKEHIEMLKEELKAAEEELKELEKSK